MMFEPDDEADTELFKRAAQAGPAGALALCGIAVAIVVAIWLLFYLLAFLPSGMLQ